MILLFKDSRAGRQRCNNIRKSEYQPIKLANANGGDTIPCAAAAQNALAAIVVQAECVPIGGVNVAGFDAPLGFLVTVPPSHARADEYPNRPITILVGSRCQRRQ